MHLWSKMLFYTNGFIHVTLHKVSSTNVLLEIVETSKNFKVEVRDNVIPELGSMLISGLYLNKTPVQLSVAEL